MSGSPTVSRPATVTIATVFAYISGALSIIGGIVLVLARDEPGVDRAVGGGSGASTALLVVGIVMVIVGLITVAVARGLSHGNNGTRLFVTVLQLLSLVGGIYALTQPAQRSSAVGSVLTAVIVLALLWNSAANRFFASR